jgi:hypothetical protein
MALACAASAQESVTLTIWLIDSNQGRPGPTDPFQGV